MGLNLITESLGMADSNYGLNKIEVASAVR